MTEVNLTPEQQAEAAALAAAACVADRDNYHQFVRNLASDPSTYNVSYAAICGLREALGRLIPASLELDHFKRVFTYGEKIRINPPVTLSGPKKYQEAPIPYLSEMAEKRLLLAHGLLGIMTEAIELAPILTAVLNGDEVDMVNLTEELGDLEWYEALVEQAAGITHKQIIKRNVKKLHKRYKGGVFTAKEALNRNLDEERVALGGEEN